MLPNNAVEYFVSYYDYYQPEAYIAQTDTYIEKDCSINDDVERLRHSATSSLLSRRDVVVVASVSCIYGLGTPQSYLDRSVQLEVGVRGSTATRCCGCWSTCSTPATICRSPADRSGCAATPSRSSRRTRSWRSGSSSSATRSRRCTTCTRSPGTWCGKVDTRADLPGHALRRGSGADGTRGHATSRPSSRSGSPSSRTRASCSRRSGCGCAPSTTSR